jgi:hypothetical protein
MAPEPIPEAVLLFLHRQIDSVRELETLLTLRASATTTTAHALAAKMRSGARWTEEQLEGLHAKGLVASRQTAKARPAMGTPRAMPSSKPSSMLSRTPMTSGARP